MYKIFRIEEIEVLNSGRWSGTVETVRRSNDGTQFVTQLRNGISPKEGEVFLTHFNAIEIMSSKQWKVISKNIF